MHKNDENGLADLLGFAMGKDKEAVQAEAEAEEQQKKAAERKPSWWGGRGNDQDDVHAC